MPRVVAFLRAINVGKRRVKMADLCRLFTGLSFQGVESFIASGNVVFDDPGGSRDALENKIEVHLHKSLGYEVDTYVRSLPELVAIAAFDGLEPVDKQTLRVGFLKGSPPGTALAKLQTETDELVVTDTCFFWLCRTSMLDSKITGVKLERALGEPTTMRSMKTVYRLIAKFG